MEVTAVRVPLLAAAILVLATACGGGPATTGARPGATATAGQAASPAGGPCPPTGGGEAVSIASSTFDPGSVSVAVGGQVTWTNADSFPHTVTFDDVDCGRLSNGASATRTFETAGTFNYSCTIHPSMRGTVTVQ